MIQQNVFFIIAQTYIHMYINANPLFLIFYEQTTKPKKKLNILKVFILTTITHLQQTISGRKKNQQRLIVADFLERQRSQTNNQLNTLN